MIYMAENEKTISNSLRRICFTGIRGTGKTTLIEKVKGQNPDVCFMSGSSILQKLMGKSYSQFEFLPEDDKYTYRLKVNKVLYETQRDNQKDLLVDSHLTVLNLKNGEIDTIFTHKDYAFFTDLILFDSTPDEIYSHRKNDIKKKRIVDLETIKCELDLERKTSVKISKDHGIELHVIYTGKKEVDDFNSIIANNGQYYKILDEL